MIRGFRLLLPFLALFLGFSTVAARLFQVQVWEHDVLAGRVARTVLRERPLVPCRGAIQDRTGRALAMSVRTYTIFVDPRAAGDLASAAQALHPYGIVLPPDIAARNPGSSYVPLQENIDMPTMLAIKALNLRGIGFMPEYRRQYPEGRLACHVLGVVGRDGVGLEGIELMRNAQLAGERTTVVSFRDGRGREIAGAAAEQRLPTGNTVMLTIDRGVQFIAEQEIEKAWRASGARRAMAIVQDACSGELLALACRPGYDPNAGAADWAALRNPAVCDMFEPGSTFKLITLAAALSERAVRPEEMIWCENGAFPYQGHTIRDHEKKGMISVSEIMECSSNVGFAKIGLRLGRERLYRYVRQFGFGSRTGIELPGEARGLLAPPEKWSGLSVPIISFGQEIGATALQVANAYTAVANGGELLEPRIVREVRDPAGTLRARGERRVIRRVVSPEISRTLLSILTGVVERGTGQLAQVPGYTVCGKTGTAQKRDPRTGKYSTSHYVASFCGMIPARAPRLTILVVLDEPQGDYWASSRAAPVFARIAGRAVTYLRIPPDRSGRPATVPSRRVI